MKRVAVLVPVLARPWRVRPLLETFQASTQDATLYFLANQDDELEVAAIVAESANLILCPPDARSWARKINAGYFHTRQSGEPWMLLGADDLVFRPGWVEAVQPVLDAGSFGVIGTNDLGNPDVIAGRTSTHPLVSRRYADERGTVDRVGVVVHDEYRHNFPDTELCETAKARGQYLHASSCIIEHMHPDWGKGSDDKTYLIGRRTFDDDRRLYLKRARKHGWPTS